MKGENGNEGGWIGVDLDGTLAFYDGWKGCDHVGAPIGGMLFRVKKWLADGRRVKIFTARVSTDGSVRRDLEAARSRLAITEWCLTHIGEALPITCMKDYAMVELWDDRAVQVVANKGEPVGKSTRGLE